MFYKTPQKISSSLLFGFDYLESWFFFFKSVHKAKVKNIKVKLQKNST